MRVLNTDYSWRADRSVPAFPDEGAVAVMDATCGLCARGATWIARNVHQNMFRIIPMQSQLGGALMRHFDMDPEDPLSWLYLQNGLGYSSLDAVVEVGKTLGGRWWALTVFQMFPAGLRDAAYRVVARNRYRLMGRTDLCALPDPDVQSRLLQ